MLRDGSRSPCLREPCYPTGRNVTLKLNREHPGQHGGHCGALRGPPSHQPVEPSRVLTRHLPRDVVGKMLELLGDVLGRLRPHAVGVRIVTAPHQRLDAHLVDQLGADPVVLEGRLALARQYSLGLSLSGRSLYWSSYSKSM